MMDWLITTLIVLVAYVPVYVIFAFLPYFSRKTVSFGIGIPQEHYNDPVVENFRRECRNAVLGDRRGHHPAGHDCNVARSDRNFGILANRGNFRIIRHRGRHVQGVLQ